ncbi:lactose permease [Escherichia coli]|uniref:Lactose permease n=1 Tax=Escherichia coli TaxID=562 RepID=A0A377AY97_ECOLX|nr:lactose permease [Escherichia coli]
MYYLKNTNVSRALIWCWVWWRWGFTLISVFTLSGPGPLSLLRRQVNEVA